jgi:Glycogen recognition site of AMP-activated protein kinase
VDEEFEASADQRLQEVVRALRAPVALGDGAVERAMAELRREALRGRRWRRAAALVAVAAALALVTIATLRRRPSAAPAGVTFALAAPAAARVSVIGDFNDWNADVNPLRRENDNWSVILKLKPGRYRYSFVVDGSSWRADPATPPAEDDFGTPTSVITVTN